MEHITEIGLRMTARSNNWEELSKASKYIGKYVLVGKITYGRSKLNEGNKLNLKTQSLRIKDLVKNNSVNVKESEQSSLWYSTSKKKIKNSTLRYFS